jgi:hypothetical protein
MSGVHPVWRWPRPSSESEQAVTDANPQSTASIARSKTTPARAPSFARGLGVVGLAALSIAVFASACSELLGDVEIETNALTPGGRGQGLAGTCELGAVQCEGAALQLCSPDGSRWITTSVCGSPELCETDPPSCEPPECALDQLSCDGAVLRVCNPGRDGWVELETCASPAHCSPNARQCMDAPCVAGELACNQEELSRCADDELGWVALESCDTQALCELARAESAVAGAVGGCVAAACEAGAARCVGGALERCNEGRTAYEVVDECTNEALCQQTLESGSAVCDSPSCVPGEHRCREETLTVCNEAQTGFDDKTVCDSAALCDPVSGSCQPSACEPGARRCNGARIEVCNEDRSGFETATDAPCASAALCIQESVGEVSCRPPECFEGQFNCTSEGLLQRCSSGLDAFEEVRLCTTPELCDATLGPQGCRPAVCESGARRCEGTAVVVCREGRDGFDTVTECGALGCVAATASCQAAACERDETRCRGARLEVCNEARSGFRLLETCATEALCVEVGNSNRFECQAPACDAGETRCRNNGDLQVCNAAQTAFSAVNCGLLGCNANANPPECRTLRDLLGN